MKKSAILFSILFACWQTFSQCDPRLSIKIPDDPNHFIKSGDSFMPYENDTIRSYSFILYKGKEYRINIFESDEFKSKASYSLYEGGKLLGTNYSKKTNKSFPYFDFICNSTAEYKLIIQKLYNEKYCGSWMLQEIKDTQTKKNQPNQNKNSGIGNNGTFIIVDEMPEFIAGEKGHDSFINWLNQHVNSLEKVKEKNMIGRIFVQFTVAEDGSVEDVKIVRGLDQTIDEAILELVKNSPKWEKPGKQREKNVKVSFTFPVTIK